jgi:hypothetical protein
LRGVFRGDDIYIKSNDNPGISVRLSPSHRLYNLLLPWVDVVDDPTLHLDREDREYFERRLNLYHKNILKTR